MVEQTKQDPTYEQKLIGRLVNKIGLLELAVEELLLQNDEMARELQTKEEV